MTTAEKLHCKSPFAEQYYAEHVLVEHLVQYRESNSIQYPGDTSVYLSNSIRNIQLTLSILKTDTKNFNTWSKNNGLVFNNDKLLSVLFTSKRTVYDRSYLMKSNGKSFKQKPTVKLIVITCLQFNFE